MRALVTLPAAFLAALSALAIPAQAEPFRALSAKPGAGVERVTLSGDAVVVTLTRAHDGRRRFQLDLVGDRVRLHPAAPVEVTPRPDDILPDGEVAVGQGRVTLAWLAGASRRYDHAVLGDAIEATELVAMDRSGRERRFRLPQDSVFEDRLVRLADLTGDGEAELIVVRSYRDAGAAIAVFAAADDDLRLLAESPPIGRPYRWLNPVGVADFDGDGAAEIAVVITPHIGGTLALYGLQDGRLVRRYDAWGFSNHAMGSRELGLSTHARLGEGGAEVLAVPAADRRSLRLVSFAGGKFVELQVIAHHSAIDTAVVAADLDGDGIAELAYGLADGSIIVVRKG